MKHIEIKIDKTCKNCSHYKVCKFRHAAEEFSASKLMRDMYVYPESNNILETFESNIKPCKHYIAYDESYLKSKYTNCKHYTEVVGERICTISHSDTKEKILVSDNKNEYILEDVLKYITILI